MTLHRDLAEGRWSTLTLVEQMGNAGAEVGRALSARATGREDRVLPAFDRALDLLDLTLADRRWSGPQLREIARARELLCDLVVGDNIYRTLPDSLDAYFTEFALAARRDR